MEENLPTRKKIRLQNYDYSETGAYFITICTNKRRKILSKIVGVDVPDDPRVELTAYGKIADKYINQLNNFYANISVEQYVIMPNHIHMILFVGDGGSSRTSTPTDENICVGNGSSRTSTPTGENICVGNGSSRTSTPTVRQHSAVPAFVSTFKRFCNKEIGKNIWQRYYYDHVIRNKCDFEEISKYIYENPLKWQFDSLYTEE